MRITRKKLYIIFLEIDIGGVGVFIGLFFLVSLQIILKSITVNRKINKRKNLIQKQMQNLVLKDLVFN